MFKYQSEILRVIDGDTVVARIVFGFNTSVKQTLRLHGINAPEVRGGTADDKRRGRSATAHLKKLIEHHKPIIVETIKDRTGKYGRYLAILNGHGANAEEVNLNFRMVCDGHAEVIDG